MSEEKTTQKPKSQEKDLEIKKEQKEVNENNSAKEGEEKTAIKENSTEKNEKKVETEKNSVKEKTVKDKNIISTSEIKTGMYIKVYQKISEVDSKGKEKIRTQAFEGLVIRRKHGNQTGATFTVRKEYKTGHVVEKIYPINLPSIEKVELLKNLNKVKKSKILFVRNKKRRKLKYETI
ncbi:50S ribosomal protein L19 [Patescibacteria group bacterium]|nr:50S ribosomal protein L19 [Patescibacteria group bacterium]